MPDECDIDNVSRSSELQVGERGEHHNIDTRDTRVVNIEDGGKSSGGGNKEMGPGEQL